MAIQEALDFIRSHQRLLLTTHDSADADGIGAEYALVKAARALGKDCLALNGERIPEKWSFLDPDGLIGAYRDAGPGALDGRAAVLLDSNDLGNAGIPDLWDPRWEGRLFVIDHHEASQSSCPSWLDPGKSSTCEMVLELVEGLGTPLGEDAASGLFAGMSFDTGSFSYSKTTELTFDAARRLVAAGASPARAHALLRESQTTAALLLMKRAVSGMEILAEGRVAVQALSKADFTETGARYEDADGIINIPLSAKDVEVSILFKESPEGLLRCSFRSKGLVNVAAIAQRSGGGGHKAAAGFKCKRPLAAEKADAVLAVEAALRDAARR